jgi:nucleoside-diphosphate-sugar epimerase
MILVTGATGLVGGNLLWRLLQQNERVAAIRRPTSNPEPLRTIFSFYTSEPDAFLARIDWRLADVLEQKSIEDAFVGIDVVYHCAAVVSLGGSDNTLSDTNVLGTRNIVEAALKANIKKLCFVSSIAACGSEKGNKKIDENSQWKDDSQPSAYAQSKYSSEQEVWKGIEKGLNTVIVNPGVILGVSGTDRGSAQLFTQVQKGLIFYSFGGSGYVGVQDVVRAMVELTNSAISGERFILVAENNSNKDILSWIADGFDLPRPYIPVGKELLWLLGIVSELLGKLFRFQPLIDRGTARSAANREYFSAQKIETAIPGFKFQSLRECIIEICEFHKRISI